MSLTSYRAAPPRAKWRFFARSCSNRPAIREVRGTRFFVIMSQRAPSRYPAFILEVDMGDKPALRPKTPIGPALRAIAASILAHARKAIGDPERASEDTVHEFRRAMKQWRAYMRLLEPHLADAARWRAE